MKYSSTLERQRLQRHHVCVSAKNTNNESRRNRYCLHIARSEHWKYDAHWNNTIYDAYIRCMTEPTFASWIFFNLAASRAIFFSASLEVSRTSFTVGPLRI